MPRAKILKKATPVVAEKNGVELNDDETARVVMMDKPKGRVGKKSKDGAEKPINSVKEPEENVVNEKPKGRGSKRTKPNTRDIAETQDNGQAPKPAVKGRKKTPIAENGVTGRGSKNSKRETTDQEMAIDDNVAEVPVAVVEEPLEKPSANRPIRAKAERKVKQSKNLRDGNVQDEAPSAVKNAAAPTKGRKKKEVDGALPNGSSDVESALESKQKEVAVSKDTKPKKATKRGRTKKSEDVAVEPEAIPEKSPKKKSKRASSESVKDEKNEIETPEETKTVADKKDKAGTSKKAAAATKKPAGRKRAVDDNVDNDVDEAEDSKHTKGKKALLNPTETSYSKADFELSVPAVDGNISNVSSNGGEHQRTVLKISSWNVAGLRAWLKKDGLKFLDYEEPDIFCMQEVKCTMDQLPEEEIRIPGYHPYWLCLPGGHAGVALYSKIMPINVEYGIGNEEFDNAGRLITAEYEKFYLVNVYVPNSGRKLVNLEARMRWEKLFQAYVKKLDALKPVIITGDMNVAHQEIDIANPKSNKRNAGFTIEEREKMTELLALGFVDTYRHLYPDKSGAYTYWAYFANARARNIGWRLDYFLVSERILKRVLENAIRSQCLGSDHCPITLFINM